MLYMLEAAMLSIRFLFVLDISGPTGGGRVTETRFLLTIESRITGFEKFAFSHSASRTESGMIGDESSQESFMMDSLILGESQCVLRSRTGGAGVHFLLMIESRGIVGDVAGFHCLLS